MRGLPEHTAEEWREIACEFHRQNDVLLEQMHAIRLDATAARIGVEKMAEAIRQHQRDVMRSRDEADRIAAERRLWSVLGQTGSDELTA